MFSSLCTLPTSSGRSTRTTCRLAFETLEAREVPASITIGGHAVISGKTDYLAYIKHMTVPPDHRDEANELKVFNGQNMAAIHKLEDPLRRQIFNAMYFNPHRKFNFPDIDAAEQNVELRVHIINFMNQVGHQKDPAVNTLDLDFSYYGKDKDGVYHAPTANSDYWTLVPYPNQPVPSREFQYVGHDSYQAIMSIADAPYVGECLGTVQIAILYSAAEVMGEEAFEDLFPDGLIFGPQQNSLTPSVMQLLPESQQIFEWNNGHYTKITRPYMVPGDWVYMQNRDDYFAQTHGAGFWNGENSIYLGRYDRYLHGKPVYNQNATPRFSGLGVYGVSEAQLRTRVWHGYCQDVYHPEDKKYYDTHPYPAMPVNSGIRWTVDVCPGTSDY